MMGLIHLHTANMRPTTFPPLASRFPNSHVFMVRVADLPNRRLTSRENLSHLSGLQTDLYVDSISSHHLSRSPRAPDQLAAPAWLELDIVDDGPCWHILKWQRVADPHFSLSAGLQAIPNLQTF